MAVEKEEGIRSKIGYGNSDGIDEQIETKKLDGGDLIITRDSNELVFLEPTTAKKIPIQSKDLVFDDYEVALSVVNEDTTSYAGKTIMIADDDGNYQPYTLQSTDTGFTATPVGGLTVVEF